MTPQEIRDIWIKVFPKSNGYTLDLGLGGPSTFSGRLMRDRSECANGILENDPLRYTLWIEEGQLRESALSLLVTPRPGVNLCYESARLRMQTIKNPTPEKVERRFLRIRDFIIAYIQGSTERDPTGKGVTTQLRKRAAEFAREAHNAIKQKRKWTGEPYYLHPYRVAGLVQAAGGTDEMVAAAYLHDVVEDTDVTGTQIGLAFGADVTRLVAQVTKIAGPDIPKPERMARNAAWFAAGSPGSKLVKVADIIDNLLTVEQLSPEIAKPYFAEKRALLGKLSESAEAAPGGRMLYRMLTMIISEYYTRNP